MGRSIRICARRYEGYFEDATREQAQRRLPVVAQDLLALVKRFEADPRVNALPSYGLLADPCDVTEGAVETPAVSVKEGKEVDGTSLQSPHDPDATYGHEGKGDEVQVVQTRVKENPYQISTAVERNGAHASDQNATVPMVETLIANGNTPDELLADTGYGSGENIVGCAELGVVLVAPVQHPDAPKRPERWIGEGATEPPAKQAASAPGKPEPVTPAPAASPSTHVMMLGEFPFNGTFREVLTCPHGVAPTKQHSTVAAQCATLRPTATTAPCAGGTRGPRRPRANAHSRRPRSRRATGCGAESSRPCGAEEPPRIGRVRGGDRADLAVVRRSLALHVKRAIQHHTERLRATLDGAPSLGRVSG